MKKLKSTFLAVFGVLFLLCTALFAVGCSIGSSSAETPETQGSSRSSYTVSVDVNDASLGTCLLSAANDGEEYIEGTPVTVTVQPKEGYLAQLFVDGEEVSLTDNTYTFNISKDTRLAVNYSYEYYVRSDVYPGDAEVILSDPANGIRYAEGEEVTVTVKPYEGYVVGSVLLNGVAQTLTYDAENGTYSFKFNITTASYVMVACAKGCEVTVENDAEKGSVTLNGAACTADTVLTFKGGETAELSVVAKDGNTVKGVYAFDEGHPGGVLIPLENNVGTVKFTDDTVIRVIYDEYYEVTATAVGGGAVRFNKQPATLGYAEGTALILTATPDTGKTVNSVTMLAEGKEVDITDKLIGNDYSFTVTEDVEFQVKFSDPKVSISFNNSAFGTYTLEGAAAKPDGTYEAGSELTLTATPSRGFKFGYFMVDGKRAEGVPIEDSDAYSYSFTVQENIEICIFFFIGTRYNVKLNADGLGGYGVTAALSEDIMGYDGEEVTVHVATEGPLPAGKAVFYSVGGGARKLLVGDSFTATIEGKNLSLKVFVADLVMPVITFTDGEEYEYSVELVGGNFVITLTDPEDAEGAHFNEWIVMVNGVKADLTEDAEGKTHSFSLPYSEESGEMNVSVTVNWGELVSLTVNAGDHGTATGGGYLQKGLVSITIVPESGYRVKSVKFTSDGDGSQISLRNIDSLGSVTENFTLTVDTTVEIEYQQIFTVTFALANSDPDTATFAVTTDPSNAFSKNTGNVWTLDSGTQYAFTVTASTNYSVRSVKIGAEEKVTAPADTFTLDNLTLTADVRVEVQTVALVAVNWSVVGPATLSVKNGQTELRSGGMVEKGAALTVKVSLNSGLTLSDYVITLTANGDEQTTTTDTYTVTASAQTELVATAAKKLTVNFPAAPSTPSASPAESEPTQGTWTSMDSTAGASSEQLVFTQNTLVIGTDPVKEITTEGADGSTVYTLTTEGEKSYTLSWFNKTAGYILALEESTASGTALFAARAGERTTYYLNPNLAENVLHAAADEALNGTWKADGSELTVGANEGKMTLTLDATSATYIIKVSGELYFVILKDGILPYVMTYQEGALTFDGTSYTKQTEEVKKTITGVTNPFLDGGQAAMLSVVVSQTGYDKAGLEKAVLLVGDTQVGNPSVADNKLSFDITNIAAGTYTLKFMLDGEHEIQGFVAVSVNIGNKTFSLAVDGKLTITEEAVEKKAFHFHNGAFENGVLNFYFETTGYSVADLNAATLGYGDTDKRLTHAPNTPAFNEAGAHIVYFDLRSITTEGVYALSLVFGNEVYPIKETSGMNLGTLYTDAESGKTYVISIGSDTQLTLTVGSTTAEYAVSVSMTGNGSEGDFGYELKKNDGAVFNPETDKVKPTDTLTLTVKVPEGYTANVKTEHCNAVRTAEANVYTIDLFGEGAKITIAYEKNSIGSVTAVSGAVLQDNFLYLFVDTQGEYSKEYVRTKVKLVCGEKICDIADLTTVSDVSGRFKVWYNSIIELPVGDYNLSVKIDGTNTTFTDLTVDADVSKTFTWTNGNKFALEVNDTQLILHVTTEQTVDPQPQQKSVDGYHNDTLIEGVLDFYVHAHGYENAELINDNIKLIYDGIEIACSTNGNVVHNSIKEKEDVIIHVAFDLKIITEHNKAELLLKIGDATYSISYADMNKSCTVDSKVYTTAYEDGKVYLTVTAESAKFRVAVTEEGKPEGGGYTLMNGETAVENETEVTVNTQLTLTVTVPGGYIATVKVNDSVLPASSENKYTITVTGITEITITYAEGMQPAKSIKKVTGAILERGLFYLLIDTEGYSLDDVNSNIKLLCNETITYNIVGIEQITDPQGRFKVWFNAIIDLSIGDYTLSIKDIVTEAVIDNLTDGANVTSSIEVNSKKFTLEVKDAQLILHVSSNTSVGTEKKVSFAGTSFYLDGTKIRLALNVTIEGYSDQEKQTLIGASTLKIGDVTIRLGEHPENSIAWFYFIVDGDQTPSVKQLNNGTYDVVLNFDGKEYPCPTVDGAQIQNPIVLDGRIYTLAVAEGKLTLKIEEAKATDRNRERGQERCEWRRGILL